MMQRRDFMQGMVALTALSAPSVSHGEADSRLFDAVLAANDAQARDLMSRQQLDPNSRGYGACADGDGLYQPGSAAALAQTLAASYLSERSALYRDVETLNRIQLAAKHLQRVQSPDGFIDLLTTNFNSPPDTGFVIHHAASAARLARMAGDHDIESALEPFLRLAAEGLRKGGVHTPNHRWVVSSALAQLNELYPDEGNLKRIDEWLSEGIDVDEDGQFTEKSTTIYNAVCDRAFVVMAHKLKRPGLLDPVRRNLSGMLYLLHSNGGVVTEISSRQDVNTRGDLQRYWFPLRYLAIHDGDGVFAGLARSLEPRRASLADLMEYPELLQAPPAAEPPPDDYVKTFARSPITRIRRKKISATLIHQGNSRFFSLHAGDAAVGAVRFASAFFGKGQFIPETFRHNGGDYEFSQSLQAGYYQPLPNAEIGADRDKLRQAHARREVSELCKMDYAAVVREIEGGFEIELSARGTDNVPLAVEINLAERGEIEGCAASPVHADSFLFEADRAVYRRGNDTIHIGPGLNQHAYTQVRGAQDKMPGPAIYLTGYTPFHHTFQITVS
ncbi:MAG: hypothetical protein GC154_11350 [bacterium]|nr:hypothetical protein [bacterium]